MKRVGRYLLSHPWVVFEYARVPEREVRRIAGYSDSDWAGGKARRRSMSGGMMTFGEGVIKAWSNRQASVALSSGEAEYYSARKAAAEGVAMGWHGEIQSRIDASAARSMTTRQGIGRVRHFQVRHLWLQALVKAGVVRIEVVKGKFKPADILTKILSYLEAIERLQFVGLNLS